MSPAAGAGEYIERIGRAMAGIREIARQYRDEIMYGIAWVAIWKVGRSWNARAFWLNADSDMIEDEDMQDARDIVAADANAIFINEYYCAHMGNGTVEDIVAGIRFHYGNGYNMLADSTAYEPGEDLKKEETIAMEIKDFATKVSTEVKKELGTGYEVGLKEVRKNNGIIRHGLAIMPQGQDVKADTIIYMEEFLEAHVSGMPFREVVRKVVGAYRQNMPEDCADIRSFHIFEKVRDRICFRLIGRKGNEELLEDVPHADFLDLAVCLYYACQEEGLGGGIIPIRNSHVEMWGTKKSELFSLAGRNTPRLFPWTCSSMDEVIAEALSFERADGGEDGWPEDGMPMPGTPMKVLSNVKWVHGAACMLYPGVLEALAQEEGCGFYILPSSVNEVLLLPDTDETLAADELKQMVMDVNRTQVAPEEVLSDSLYRYDAVRKEVMKI